MVAGTTIVVLLTAIAPALGPHLTGLVAAFPVYAVVLAGFTHHLDGRAQAMEVLRGLLIGLVAFTGFFAVINVTLESLELAVSFGAALSPPSSSRARPSPPSGSSGRNRAAADQCLPCSAAASERTASVRRD